MSTPLDIPGLSSDLTVYAARLVRLVRRANDLPAGGRVLSILDELGPLTVTALARHDQCSQPTMTGQVTTLVERGHVAKEPHPADARSTLVALTAAGRAELDRFRVANGGLVAARLAAHPDLSPDDLATAVAVLQAVVATPVQDPDPEGAS